MTDITPDQLQIIKQWLGSGSINIFGPPFAGKDTQGEELASLFNAPLLGGGQILRSSPIPPHVKEIMELGELIPTEDFIKLVLPYLSQPAFDNKPLILSAVGRWHGEEEGVVTVTTQSNHPLKAVIYLDLSEEIIWQRWQTHKKLGNRGTRKDDAPESLEIRLKEFHKKTPLVIEYYRDKGMLIEIDGSLPSEEVFNKIINGLLDFASAQKPSLSP